MVVTNVSYVSEAVFVTGGRRLAAAAVVAALTAVGLVVAAMPSRGAARSVNEVYRVPPNGVFTVLGHGWGHGHGMSQYGAYGAAKVRGLDYRQILDFYYPRTDLVGQPLATTVRVLLHAASDDRLGVAPRQGLTASTSVDGVPDCALPESLVADGPAVTAWRARVVSTPDGRRLRLQATTDDGKTWAHPRAKDCDQAWTRPLDGSITFDG